VKGNNQANEQTKMSLITREQIERQYQHALRVRKHRCGETAISFYHHLKDFALLNMDETKEQMKMWRKWVKNGEIEIIAHNNKNKEVNGKMWYCLVVNPKPNTADFDPFGLMVLGEMVSGYIYAFDKEHNRDAAYKYANRIKDE
jgi:hypothetical protein